MRTFTILGLKVRFAWIMLMNIIFLLKNLSTKTSYFQDEFLLQIHLTRSKNHNSNTKLISLKLTIQLHHKKNWKKYDLVNLKCCPVCEQTFKYLTSLFKHLINIHNVEKESINIICTKCHSDFQDVKTYKGHLYKAVCKYWIIHLLLDRLFITNIMTRFCLWSGLWIWSDIDGIRIQPLRTNWIRIQEKKPEPDLGSRRLCFENFPSVCLL